ncbi:aminodeoxychorismate synthase component I [Rugamonas sp. CCM 8940]|uniref:aminodeoxychorismate synthase component I n=1 Tax=Rugamonas sp. CCM 8940 TaxID=2765359 RepID=UPI0018F72189|nr:aminodeoxychorismate synthase component I [Rugamonas sp. CCM 8940]MBJ7309374.1 aminodeoxychorismate synthase component I [Rugamonas sp. CCM 8940]
MNPAACFALLDDASPDGAAHSRSRLYTGHAGTLACADIDAWPALLDGMQRALARGLHAVALCSYELGGELLQLAAAAARRPAPGAPLARVLLFEQCQSLSPAEVGDWLAARSFPLEQAAGIAGVAANVDQAAFAAALARIHGYIEAGDTYQVNYTYRLRFDAFGSLFALYSRLRARQPVPYGALVALDDGSAVLSLSPELFVRHAGGTLTARPMKGTAPAAASNRPAENAARAAALAADPKNRAENLMIVDLLRNDIGRIAATGSVAVPALFEVRRYSRVLQMTSTVTARLRPGTTLAEIFQALYPCGSITGAPKRRTMEIIAELEPAPRGLYTGAIGWFEPAPAGAVGDFCLSVPIRTLALQAPRNGVRSGEMGVGAGIVYDSDAAQEFAECQLKARFLTGLSNDFELFETLYASGEQGARHQERHLARLAASAAYFGFACDLAAARAYLAAACAELTPGVPHRVRLALTQSGAFAVQQAPLVPLVEPVRALLAADATSSGELFLRHKSSERARYDAAWRAAEAQGAFDSLFFNERGELTEGGRSNVFVKLDGRWYTPPLSCGVLPGVMRGVLLDDPAWAARQRVISRAMLQSAEEIVLCNALRGALRATLQGEENPPAQIWGQTPRV